MRMLILNLLALSDRDTSGLELIQASGGQLQRGTVYVYLELLTDDGLVERVVSTYTKPHGLFFRLTEGGRQKVAEQ